MSGATEHDVIVIGAGAAGEAAAGLGATLGSRIAVVEHELVGGECAFWACMPSKALLDAARRRHIGADYPWSRASDRRDWMISREGIDVPDDSSHVKAFEDAGVVLYRGEARVVGPGRVEVRPNDAGAAPVTLEARALVVSTGATPVTPPIEGLEETGYWTSRDATSTRELPSSILVLGGGPIGIEMAQVFVRFGVPVTVVESSDGILSQDHPRSSEAVADQLREEGVELRLGVKASAVRAGGRGRVVTLSDGSEVEAAQVLVAVGRRPRDLRALGLEEAGIELDERGGGSPDERLSLGDGVFAAGDAVGGLQFTHLADYEGRVAARAALGHDVRADLSSVPRVTYTDPEVGAVGLTVEEARERGIDAFEVWADFAHSAKGFTIEGSRGHMTAVVDRERGVLVGAFAASFAAGELISEAVLAIKQRVPVAVLADTIRAFPTASRVLGNVFQDAAAQLG